MFRRFLYFLLLQPLLFSCNNSPDTRPCVAFPGGECQQNNGVNSNPSPSTNYSPPPSPIVVVVVAPTPPQPSASNSPTPAPTKPEPSQKEIKKRKVINSLTQNTYKIHRNIIKFINTAEGLKYQRIHTRETITTDVCSISDYEEMKIKILCSESNNVREIIVDLNGDLEHFIVNFYESNSSHVTSKHVMSKIKENSVSKE